MWHISSAISILFRACVSVCDLLISVFMYLGCDSIHNSVDWRKIECHICRSFAQNDMCVQIMYRVCVCALRLFHFKSHELLIIGTINPKLSGCFFTFPSFIIIDGCAFFLINKKNIPSSLSRIRIKYMHTRFRHWFFYLRFMAHGKASWNGKTFFTCFFFLHLLVIMLFDEIQLLR